MMATFGMFTGPGTDLIKNMKTAFINAPHDNARFFQQKIRNFSTDRLAACCKLDFYIFSLSDTNEFICVNIKNRFIGFENMLCRKYAKKNTYETTRIIIPYGFGITEGFQKRIGFQNNIFYSLNALSASRNSSYIIHYVFRSYCFASSRFTT